MQEKNRSLSSKWNKLSRRIQYITHTTNDWSCERSVTEHLEKVVFPYLSKKREQLKMSKDKKALLIFDVFKGQTTQQVKDVILANNSVYVFVPKNLTNHFQPLDLNVIGQAKQPA